MTANLQIVLIPQSHLLHYYSFIYLDGPPEPTTCPETQIALTSPGSEVATFQLQFKDQNLTINLPIGHHLRSIKGHDRNCNVTLYAEGECILRAVNYFVVVAVNSIILSNNYQHLINRLPS